MMKTVIREVLETIILALVIFLLVRAVVQNFKVEGSSMEPNLRSGQYLLVNRVVYLNIDLSAVTRWLPFFKVGEGKVYYPFHLPQRGDVVVFRFPRDPSRDFIKRVIGLPGETVEIKAGKVYIDNLLMEEPYIKDDPRYALPPQQVSPDHYFVLGDNRNNSSDSHVWGMVPRENIVGKAWLTYWPLREWGLVPNYTLVLGGGELPW